jgi:hypothetical protein
MIDRDHIERVLKLNGLQPTAKDEEIKSILLSARYKEHEVDAAIMVLRENKNTNKTKVDGLHKVFRTDELLNSEEISSLLGVDVNLEERVLAGSNARKVTMFSQVLLSIVAILLALVALLLYMYVSKVGLFHHTSAFTLG